MSLSGQRSAEGQAPVRRLQKRDQEIQEKTDFGSIRIVFWIPESGIAIENKTLNVTKNFKQLSNKKFQNTH